MRTADFNFPLPPELIAQHASDTRDGSRLLVLHRADQRLEHRKFPDLLDFLVAGDVLVLNNSRVIPARLKAVNSITGGQFELLLIEENAVNDWWCMMRPGKKARTGTGIILLDRSGNITALNGTVAAINSEGHRRIQFSGTADIRSELERVGAIPLPPYIHRDHELPEDRERYQTVYASRDGSIAAPTAGLHFTPDLLDRLRGKGVQICFVSLHVGLGTFLPVKSESLAGHHMHAEQFELTESAAVMINEAKASARRVIAVGTTCVRVLESVAAQNDGKLLQTLGKTSIFIHPPFHFQMVDALLTNFHLPCSTLLMLVSAFASPASLDGREQILSTYAEAIRERYRFFSYGDAMLIL